MFILPVTKQHRVCALPATGLSNVTFRVQLISSTVHSFVMHICCCCFVNCCIPDIIDLLLAVIIPIYIINPSLYPWKKLYAICSILWSWIVQTPTRSKDRTSSTTQTDRQTQQTYITKHQPTNNPPTENKMKTNWHKRNQQQRMKYTSLFATNNTVRI